MSKRLSRLPAALTLLLLPAVAAGCGGPAEEGAAAAATGAAASSSLVAYSTPKEAYEELIPAFQKTADGKGVSFTQSYGASGDQSRAVERPARRRRRALAGARRRQARRAGHRRRRLGTRTPTDGFVTNSVVVFAVRKGNPKGIKTWDDLDQAGRRGHHAEPVHLGRREVEPDGRLRRADRAGQVARGGDATSCTKLLANTAGAGQVARARRCRRSPAARATC